LNKVILTESTIIAKYRINYNRIPYTMIATFNYVQ
jgi:hypothetical protein